VQQPLAQIQNPGKFPQNDDNFWELINSLPYTALCATVWYNS
jgi:hypothetical protein